VAVTIVPRPDWGARKARDDDALAEASRRGVVIHWNGPKIGQPEHQGCPGLVRGIQDFHMDSKGWTDIAYSFVACQHGTVYEGRGWRGFQFANGSVKPPAGTGRFDLTVDGSSEHWYTVLCLTGGDHDAKGRVLDEQRPSAALVGALTGLVEIARDKGAGREVKPHNDFRVKSCPGPTLHSHVRRWDGAAVTFEEDDVTPAECEAAMRKVLRQELGADSDRSVRSAYWELSVRAVNAALGASNDRDEIDTTAIGTGSPARRGMDSVIEGSSAIANVRQRLDGTLPTLTAKLIAQGEQLSDIRDALSSVVAGRADRKELAATLAPVVGQAAGEELARRLTA